MAVELTPESIELTKREEGLVLHRYWDPYGRVWTIGYGTTSGAGVVEPIPQYCTEAQATTWLLEYLNRSVVPAILAVYKPNNSNELGGLADLGYNAGAGVFREEPMYSALRSGNRESIARAFLAFDRSASGFLAVLYHRREADAALFLREPPNPPTYHYDWYPQQWRAAIERYDQLRMLDARKQMNLKQGLELKAREAQCRKFAVSIWRNAAKRHPLKNGKPSWGLEHRGWLYQELIQRAQGKLVLPHA